MTKFKNNNDNKKNIKNNHISNCSINKSNNNDVIILKNNNVKTNLYVNDELFDVDTQFINIKNEQNKSNKSNKSIEQNKLNESIEQNKISRNRSSSISNSNNKNIYKKIEDKNIYFNELLKKQIAHIPSDKKLNYNDIKRISKFIMSSLFDHDKCALWQGYITNENNNTKGTYINFYFNKKKIALHRLLYINYIGHLSDNEYLKFTCDNKGKCCNIHHMKKYIYNNKKNSSECKNINDKDTLEHAPHTNTESVQINVDKKKLIVEI